MGPVCFMPSHPSGGRLKGGWLPMQATVGAGLPIISTLQTLLETGDEVQQIEGVLSGTLSYIFNRSDQTQALLSAAHCCMYCRCKSVLQLTGVPLARVDLSGAG